MKFNVLGRLIYKINKSIPFSELPSMYGNSVPFKYVYCADVHIGDKFCDSFTTGNCLDALSHLDNIYPNMYSASRTLSQGDDLMHASVYAYETFHGLHDYHHLYGSATCKEDIDTQEEIGDEQLIMSKLKSSARLIARKSLTNRMVDYSLLKGMEIIKNHFGIERRIEIGDYPANERQKFYDWLSQYSPEMKTQLTQLRKVVGSDPALLNCSFFVKFDNRTFAIVLIGSSYRSAISDNQLLRLKISDHDYISDSHICIYIFGKRSYRYFGKLHQILSTKASRVLYMYSVCGRMASSNEDSKRITFESTRAELPRRDLLTIFMEHGIVEGVTRHIDRYLDSRDIYFGKGIIYKTGILLYGKPGTGKTSLITALASKYNRDLIKIDMATFEHLNVDALVQTLNIDSNKYIIALEDIDCIIVNRENEDADKDDKKVINKLLQFLDSTSSPNDVIFIATTNHIELLDEALLREARFDLQVNIDGIFLNKAIEMCKSFNVTEEQTNLIIDRLKSEGFDIRNTPVRPSKLQKMILECSNLSALRDAVDEDEEN